MNQLSYAKFYDAEYRPLYHGKELPYHELFDAGIQRGKKIARFLYQNGVDLRAKRVLEVGCGSGGILSYLRDTYDCEVAGCDFGSDGIRYGREKYKLNLYEGSLASLPVEWKPDLIIYSHVFEHILDVNTECDRIKKCLSQDGLVYIEIPSVKNIRASYRWDFLRLLQNAHTFHFSLATLRNLMGVNGFKMVAGNEVTRALFKISDRDYKIRNDYDDVMHFLRTTEKFRIIGVLISWPRQLMAGLVFKTRFLISRVRSAKGRLRSLE